MKQLITFILSLTFAVTAFARDDVGDYNIKEALAHPEAEEILGTDVRFYFGSQTHKKPAKTFGEFKTNKKTNAFNKSDKEACEWVFLSAMKSLKDRALREGGNAIINIKSNYKGNLTTSNETFQCGAGAFVAGVALVGTVVKIAD